MYRLTLTLSMVFLAASLYSGQAMQGQKASSPASPMHDQAKPPYCADMVFIPAGKFEMGDHFDLGHGDELPVHLVYIAEFWIDIHEVTNREYCDYLNSAYRQGLIEVISGMVYKYGDTEVYCDTTTSTPASRITWDGSTFGVVAGKGNHPMGMVSWFGAVAYANWLSAEYGLPPCYKLETWECSFGAGGLRLPTEAEWEKAARGGLYTPYHKYPWGDVIDGSMANYWQSGDPFETDWPGTTPVRYFNGGQTPPGVNMVNGYGLYDMSGNVWEYCNDWYDAYYYRYSPYRNPVGPSGGTYRVLRGGSWAGGPDGLRCAARGGGKPGHRFPSIGFRLVLD